MSLSEAVFAVKDMASSDLSTTQGSLIGFEDELNRLKAAEAKHFQTLADALRSLSSDSRQIAGLSRQATGLATSGTSERALGMLQGILDEAEKVHALGETNRDKLHTILPHLEQSRAPLARLAKLPFFLRAVATLSRIEGSRIRNSAVDVSSLADDIEQLAEAIEKHIAAIAAEADRVSTLSGQSARRLDEAEGQQRRQIRELTQRGRAVIDSFRERTEASTATATSIDQQYAGISGAIDQIVMSLQAEDIARQRLEHIQQALSQVSSSVSADQSETAILALQRSQLLSTRKLVCDSIASIRGSLGSLTTHLEQLTAETDALAGQADRDGKSFAVSLGEELGAVASVVGQYSASAHAVVATVEAVLPALTSMSSSACEIEEIQSSIQLIALNASIKTAHLGAHGVAMGVLASEMQKITTHSEADSHAILQGLQAMDGVLKAISSLNAASSALLTSSRGDDASREVQRLSQSVSESQRDISLKLTTVRDTADSLRRRLGEACEMAGRGEAIADTFDSLIGRLESILENLGCSPGAMFEAGDKHADLASLYSMKEERELHEQLFGASATDADSEPEQAGQLAVDSGDSLGDGIELF